MCVPTLPKIFRPITGNTLIFLFGLSQWQTGHFLINVHLYSLLPNFNLYTSFILLFQLVAKIVFDVTLGRSVVSVMVKTISREVTVSLTVEMDL